MSYRLYLIKHLHLILITLFLWSCSAKDSKPIIQNHSGHLEYIIISEMGELVNPIFQDTSNFVGFPGSLGYHEEQNKLCLIFGQSISKNDKIEIHELGSLRYMIDDDERQLLVGIPTNKKYQNLSFDEQLSFNIDYNNLKLWIQDWIQNAYAHKNVIFKGWD